MRPRANPAVARKWQNSPALGRADQPAWATAHQDAIALFSGYAEGGDNDKLKSFAETTLPTLQEHQQMITTVQAGMPTQ